MSTGYYKTIETLTSAGKFHICLGLERVTRILEIMGNPQNNLKIIHVAGTNGKGSTCAILANILYKAGYNIGLYTSPHLVNYTERIKINNKEISKDDFSRYMDYVCNLADTNNIHLTEFEILTAGAFKYFSDNEVDIAVIETGLGGRLDATNVIENTLMSVITSISVDHKDRLGETIEEIAFEKAGIIKPSSDVIVSGFNQGFDVIYENAIGKKSNIHIPSYEIEIIFENEINYAIVDGEAYEFPILGLHQKQNLELVLKSIEILLQKGYNITKDSIVRGLKTSFWPGRLQYIKEKGVIIDGAHNFDAAKELIKSLNFYFPDKKRTWIYGSLDTKDYKNIIKTLVKPNDTVYFYEFENKHSIKLSDIQNCILNKINILNLSEAENILDKKMENSVKIITGSLYIVGEFINYLTV